MSIPAFYDHQISKGSGHAEGSVGIEIENVQANIEAASSYMPDRITISYREETSKGIKRGIASTPLKNLEVGSSITLPNRQKLFVVPEDFTEEQMERLKLFLTFS